MTDIGIGCVGSVLAECFGSLWKKVLEKVKMVYFLPGAVTQMKEDVVALGNEIDDINTELDQAQQIPKRTVQAWLKKAEDLKRRYQTIGHEYVTYQQHKNCIGCCPKCLHRYRISKDIRDWSRSVSELRSEKARPDFPRGGQYGDPAPRSHIPISITETGIPAPRSHIPISITETGIVEDTKRSEQRELAERLLTDRNSKIQRIGIIGMGGVGKTSLLDAINNSEEVKTSFRFIFKLTVSRSPHISDMQDLLAQKLKLTRFPDKSNPEERKLQLQSYLESRKYLILLDDMWAVDAWTPDELQELGVCLNDTGSKFVLTTRDEEVCARMNVQEKIVLEPLLEKEGWKLFRSKAFVNQNEKVPREIKEVAKKIAKKCKGLPLAIKVVAAAVTHHTALCEWEVALNQMKSVSQTFYDLHVGVDEKLFKRLGLSYNVLPDCLKSCFLYFAAYPEDTVISCERIIDMWISEGLVKESRDSYLQDIGNSYIKQLVDRCLIEVVRHGFGGRIGSVKIHDILRDLAIRIAEKEQSFFKAGQSLESFNFEEVVSKDCVKLSLMSNDLQSLPTTFPCRSLSVLLLNENRGIREVPESFLCELSSLKVLDLSDTGITSLPPSIRNLEHLASLQLQRTNIRELPEDIGDLTELQFLDVSFCHKLLRLPEKISDLKRLRVLCLDGCNELTHLPRGIKELISLEILTMSRTSIEWDFEKDANAEGAYACLKDLQNLTRLRDFDAEIKSPIEKGIMGNWSKMRSLALRFVGANGHNYLPSDMHVMKDLESVTLINCDVERMPDIPKLEELSVFECKQLKQLPIMPCLRNLYIFKCDKLEELEFPKLESVALDRLESECVGPVGAVGAASGSGGLGKGASPSPPMLKSLQVVQCPKLKRLRGRWDQSTHLEEIRGEREWWDAIQCDDLDIKHYFKTNVYFNSCVEVECVSVM